MKFSIITLFEEMFESPFDSSIIKRAIDSDLVEIEYVDLREFGVGKHQKVDDTPYGGGPGMLLRPEPVIEAIESVKTDNSLVILMTPQGQRLTQSVVRSLADKKHIILVCGRYEGFDARIRQFVDLELSIGDFVLTGGELAAMVVVDAVSRLMPGVLGDDKSSHEESFSEGDNIEYPQYTRPVKYRDMKVPEVLRSGNHQKIKAWRQKQSKSKTSSD